MLERAFRKTIAAKVLQRQVKRTLDDAENGEIIFVLRHSRESSVIMGVSFFRDIMERLRNT